MGAKDTIIRPPHEICTFRLLVPPHAVMTHKHIRDPEYCVFCVRCALNVPQPIDIACGSPLPLPQLLRPAERYCARCALKTERFPLDPIRTEWAQNVVVDI